ncbi:hypothetical protein PQX77_002318, partial [Marasmius sp. AFHP31]
MVDISTVTPALEGQKIVSYMDVVSAAILVYDVILNFELEIRHIWRKQWSIVKGLYLIQRYLPFFDTVGLTLHHHFAENLSPQYCSINYQISGWSITVGL